MCLITQDEPTGRERERESPSPHPWLGEWAQVRRLANGGSSPEGATEQLLRSNGSSSHNTCT